MESKKYNRDFPGGPVVKNLPSNSGAMGSIPGRRTKIPHAEGQLSPHAATKEALALHRKMPHATMKIPPAATKTNAAK